MRDERRDTSRDVAVIGLAGRFPGAPDVASFWKNLCDGVESRSEFSEEELVAAGFDLEVVRDPHFVKAGFVLEDADRFDAGFFGMSAREAEVTDPQQRVFLECVVEALEASGYDPARFDGLIGLYAGAGVDTYLPRNVYPRYGVRESLLDLQIQVGNDHDFVTTLASYKLGLRGPSIDVQTACSSALVAVHLACQGLLLYDCDIALAGGVGISHPPKSGYFFQEGGIYSPDGRCRAFDARAAGTVDGSGAGLVVLRRLDDAVDAGDHIHAVIPGTAVNNDGALKAGYTAPSVQGQIEVISQAYAAAACDPASVGFIEAHGTGTALGDPIEIAALTQVFRARSAKRGSCALGSVKTNVGHLGAAAGVAGLIKAVLAVEHGVIPPTVHFETANPELDLDNSPFYVNTEAVDWEARGGRRRAGVTSLGIGGTNAHVVLEAAPARPGGEGGDREELLLLSANSRSALEQAGARLGRWLSGNPSSSLADVAYTLAVGRTERGYRRVVRASSRDEAVARLATSPGAADAAGPVAGASRAAFVFPGQGAQYVDMGRSLYLEAPVFRESLDACAERFQSLVGFDFRGALYPRARREREAAGELQGTLLAQAALFSVEYALVRLWASWGVEPCSMIGNSLGEYVAACVAGVLSLEDAVAVVAKRASLMEGLPSGAMLQVGLPEAELRRFLGDRISLAAVQGLDRSVASGPRPEIRALEERLREEQVPTRRLRTAHAFHSADVDRIVEPLVRFMAGLKLEAPAIPFVSNLTGTWIAGEQATDPGYWGRHLREPVLLGPGLQELLRQPDVVPLEVGPAGTLVTVRRENGPSPPTRLLPSLPSARGAAKGVDATRTTMAGLWLAGVRLDWEAVYRGRGRRRVPLPTYPFERERYWIDPRAGTGGAAPLRERGGPSDWLYFPVWMQSPPGRLLPSTDSACATLVFADERGVGRELAARLDRAGCRVATASRGAAFEKLEAGAYVLDERNRRDYEALFADLDHCGALPRHVIHCWSLDDAGGASAVDRALRAQDLGCFSVLFVLQSWSRAAGVHGGRLSIVTSELHDVTGDEALRPQHATLLGLSLVSSQEYPELSVRVIDLDGDPGSLGDLVDEVTHGAAEPLVAYRGGRRWLQRYEAGALESHAGPRRRLRERGVYLITGGTGGIGLALSGFLARAARARLALLTPIALPPRAEWGRWTQAGRDAGAGDGAAAAVGPNLEVTIAEVSGWLPEIDAGISDELGPQRSPEVAEIEPLIDTLCASYLYDYVRGTLEVAPGAEWTRDEIRDRLGVAPAFERYLDFLLRVLVEDGIAEATDVGFRFVRDPDEVPDPARLRERIAGRYPEAAPLLDLLDRCGRAGEALTGDARGLSVLFPEGSTGLIDEVYAALEAYAEDYRYLLWTREVIARLLRSTRRRKLRILEVGAGTGRLARVVATALDRQNAVYHYTDLGRSFVRAAERDAQRRGWDFAHFDVLDISRPADAQDFEARDFDVVLGLDVVHATPNIEEALGTLRDLLAPNGLLVLVEAVRAPRWNHMISGLTAGWWAFDDVELRVESPLLSPDQWERVLARGGLPGARAFPTEPAERARAGSAFIIAQRPPDPSRPVRTSRPSRDAADGHDLPALIRSIEALEAAGAEVLVLNANVAVETEVRAALAEVRRRFGAVNGVFHLAAIAGGGVIELKTREAMLKEFEAKVAGTVVLDRVFADEELDFLVLFSSLSAVTGLFGQVGYCAANAFCDAYAHARARRGRGYGVSVDWDGWRGIGLNAGGDERRQLRHRALTELLARAVGADGAADGMSVEEGLDVLERVVTRNDAPQVVVSTLPLDALMEVHRTLTTPKVIEQLAGVESRSARHPRPELSVEYVEPRTDLERRIADICGELLGIESVGARDDIFELGADSLVAVQVLARIRSTFQVEVPMERLVDHPSVEVVANVVEELAAATAPAEVAPGIEVARTRTIEELIARADPAQAERELD